MVKDKTPAKLVQELEKSKTDPRGRLEQQMGPQSQLLALRERLTTTKDQHVHFVRLEAVGEEEGHGTELQVFGLALLEVDGPASKKFPDERQYALAILKARPKGRQYEWWVESVRFPYQPRTFVPPAKAAGHDHAD